MGQQPKNVPLATKEVIFLSCGTLSLGSEGQLPRGSLPAPLEPDQLVMAPSYTWTGAGTWRAALAGQSGGSEAAPAAGDTDGKGGKEEGSVS